MWMTQQYLSGMNPRLWFPSAISHSIKIHYLCYLPYLRYFELSTINQTTIYLSKTLEGWMFAPSLGNLTAQGNSSLFCNRRRISPTARLIPEMVG